MRNLPKTALPLLLAAALLFLGLLSVPPNPSPQSPQLTPGAVYLPFAARLGPTPTATALPTGWLAYVNYYRSLAGAPALTENPAWSTGGWLHARYIVKNDVMDHFEDPGNPWYSPEGDEAAANSSLTSSFIATDTDTYAIDSMMQAPFHAVGILDPQLTQTGFGSYREADGGLQMAAALDTNRGIDFAEPPVTFPLLWPGPGATVPIALHWGEYPSPLAACPGYTEPSGLPLIIQVGSGFTTPAVTAHSFGMGATPLAHCVFDETNYTNPDGDLQALGRAILDARDAIILVPRDPLTPGQTYTASLTTNGETYTWSFTVLSTAPTALPRFSNHTNP